MTKLTWPTSLPYRPSMMEWTFRDNARRSGKSSETGTVQYSERPGARWLFTCHWTNQTKEQRLLLFAKIAEGHGHINTFAFPFFPQPRPQLTVSGTAALVSLALQGANQVSIFGVTGLFSPGDWITIGDQLVVLHTCADLGGSLSVTFSPRLRKNWASTTSVTYHWPTGEFRLSSSSGGVSVPFGPDVYTPFSAEFEEVV